MKCCFFKDTATPGIYTLPLPDALPICPEHARGDRDASGRDARADLYRGGRGGAHRLHPPRRPDPRDPGAALEDRKSTRLNSSHANISYAVFCLKKTISVSACNTRVVSA